MRKPRQPKQESNTLLTALQFVALAQNKRGTPGQTHCRFFGNAIVGTNNILSAGHKIPEDIQACPQTSALIEAIKKCPDTIALTMLDNGILSVRSQDFQASIQCTDASAIPSIFPDNLVIPCDGDLRNALVIAASIISDKAKTIVQSSVLLDNQSILSSNGEVILEVWHGLQLPFQLVIPGLFVAALAKAKKTPIGIGVGVATLTVWFDDLSWLKTRLHSGEGFPALRPYLDRPAPAPQPVPVDFFKAVDRLAPFSRDGRAYVTAEGLRTDSLQEAGASNYAHGLPVGYSFSIEAIQAIAPIAQKFSWNVDERTTLFFGAGVRGAIGMKKHDIL